MMRRPVDRARVTGDTKSHASYGVGPATDYAGAAGGGLPIGSPIRAPFPVAELVRWGGPRDIGGYALNARSRDGRFLFVAQHLSRYRNISRADEGDVIAYSGNSGTLTTGPHLHCYVVARGVRMSMEDAIRKYGTSTRRARIARGHGVRTARVSVNARRAPTLEAPVVRSRGLRAGTTGTFDGFIRGAEISQDGITTDVWYRGAFSGLYFWAGNFTSRRTVGLTNLGRSGRSGRPGRPARRRRSTRARRTRSVVLTDSWYYFASALQAVAALKGHRGPTVPPGTYRVTGRALLAVEIQVGERRVWLHPRAARSIV